MEGRIIQDKEELMEGSSVNEERLIVNDLSWFHDRDSGNQGFYSSDVLTNFGGKNAAYDQQFIEDRNNGVPQWESYMNLEDDLSWGDLPRATSLNQLENGLTSQLLAESPAYSTKPEPSSPLNETSEEVSPILATVSEQEPRESRMNYKQRPMVNAIHKLLEEGYFSNQAFTTVYAAAKAEFEGLVLAESNQNNRKQTLASAIANKRCNQTKYIKTILKCLALASGEQSNSSYDFVSLYNELDKATKLEAIKTAIFGENYEPFVRLLKQFIVPGHLFIELVRRTSHHPAISVLLLEALLVLQLMIEQPNRTFNTWKINKLEIRGNYSQPLKRLAMGTASIQYLKKYVTKEYEKCKNKIKSRRCADSNNISHFLCGLTIQMLKKLREQQSGRKDILCEIESSLRVLEGRSTENYLLCAIKPEPIRKLLHSTFIINGRLLQMILQTDTTSSLMIMNLVHRYEEFARLLQ